MDRRQLNQVPRFTRVEDSGERPVDPSIIRSYEGLKEAILAETQPIFVRGYRNSRRIVLTAATRSVSDGEFANLEHRQAAAQSQTQQVGDKEQRDILAAKKKADRKARLLRVNEEVRPRPRTGAPAVPAEVLESKPVAIRSERPSNGSSALAG